MAVDTSDDYARAACDKLRASFEFGSWKSAQEGTLTYTGREFSQGKDFGVKVRMTEYIKSMKPSRVSHQRSKEAESRLDSKEHKVLRGLNGQLQWYARMIGIELAFPISKLASAMGQPVVGDLKEANRLIRAAASRQQLLATRPAQRSYCQLTHRLSQASLNLDTACPESGAHSMRADAFVIC